MKFSELIAYRNELALLSTDSLRDDARMGLNKILYLVNAQPIKIGETQSTLLDQNRVILNAFDQFENTVNYLKQEIDVAVREAEKPWYEFSLKIYDEVMYPNENVEHILSRKRPFTEEVEVSLHGRIGLYSDWRFPGLVIRPARETFVEHMVGLDPLYLLDIEDEMLTPAMRMFNEDYQRRLRPYTFRESLNRPMLRKLPNNQFGLVFAHNYFNYRPIEIVERLLTEIYQKLRPGGTLCFSFNDCDKDKAVMLVEQKFACYTPGARVTEIFRNIGYEQIFKYDDGGPSTWLELRKPGQLTTLRGGQSLAKVMFK